MGTKIISLWGVQGAQHPLVKIWDTVYISETIRARKSKIVSNALVGCENFSARGHVRGAAPPNVNLGPSSYPIISPKLLELES